MRDDDQQPKTGYKRPPAEHQFRKGTSGNPRGRPRKAKPVASRIRDIDTVILAEAYREVTLREGGKVLKLTALQASMRSLGINGMKGNRGAQIALAGLVLSAEKRRDEEWKALFVRACNYKDRWEEVFEHHDRRGIPRPEPLPHPDDVHLDYNTGEVRFIGPIDEKSKFKWDQLIERKQECLREIAEIRKHIEEYPEHAAFGLADTAQEQRLFDMLDAAVPDEATRRSPAYDIRQHVLPARRSKT